jgi:hypothetical protein
MTSTSTTHDIKQELARLAAGRANALRSSTASERASALAAARSEIEALRERDRSARQRAAQAAEQDLQSALAEFEARAEAARRERGTALLADVFSKRDDSLATLIADWRREPTRALTAAIRARWAELDARCKLELGDDLGAHLLAVPFIEQLAAEAPGSLSLLCAVDYAYGVDGPVIAALGAWSRAADGVAAGNALADLERALLVVAQRGAGQLVEEHHRELAQLRRASCTRTDLAHAQSEYSERRRQAELEAAARNARAPMTLDEALAWRAGGGASLP